LLAERLDRRSQLSDVGRADGLGRAHVAGHSMQWARSAYDSDTRIG